MLTCPSANNFLRQLFVLRSLLSQEQISPKDLAHSLISLIGIVVSIVSSSGTSSPPVSKRANESQNMSRPFARWKRASHNNNALAAELSMISSSINYLLDGLNHLRSADSGPVVYEFIRMFRDCLFYIVHKNPSGYEPVFSPKRDRFKVQASLQVPNSYSQGKEGTIDHAGRFLVVFLSSLDPQKEAHQNILDGCMYFLLTEVGLYLSASVFEDETATRRSQNHGIATDTNADATANPRPSLTSSAAIDLIWILERVLVLNDKPSFKPGQTTPDTLPVGLHGPAERVARLSNVARIRLQDTLLRPLFKDQHATFMNSFKEPDLSNLMIDASPPMIRLDDVCNWFKQEVWRIVGWDTIREKIEWQE